MKENDLAGGVLLMMVTLEVIPYRLAEPTATKPVIKSSVSDPYSFFPDPDPEVEAGDQYGSESGSNPDPGL